MTEQAITHFNCDEKNGLVEWEFQGKHIKKTYQNNIIALKFKSNKRVLILDMSSNSDVENAMLYDSDGEVLKKIKNPKRDKGAICFEDVYYVKSEITLIIALHHMQFAMVINEDGEEIRCYETR